jgi:hypothetical protein
MQKKCNSQNLKYRKKRIPKPILSFKVSNDRKSRYLISFMELTSYTGSNRFILYSYLTIISAFPIMSTVCTSRAT